MHPPKKQKAVTPDLNWCINNSSSLTPSIFIETFNYGDKASANKRYTSILDMKRFNNFVPNASQLRADFNLWKGSQQEVTFWNNRKIELARETANARSRVSVITSIGRIGAQEGLRLGRDSKNKYDSSGSSSEVDNNCSLVRVIINDEETLVTDDGDASESAEAERLVGG
ncbi:hypothetical protein INT45_009968 [Circinella minor]|uniref:Uncharacterized protein n=1 Tax=Circinella minor TaxID=1195481 RepID=A0A8H7RXB2_9FUNG|nr:hypothetical protein INT45_009968 [Circinella minor]